jgi:23S rRNA (guanosine2251-2'-O)-methyltransferase
MSRKLKNEELGRLTVQEFRDAEKLPVIIVLDNVRSLHNVGSVFRTADAFRIVAIYLCGYTGTPPNKEINKTALGATETVTWKFFATTMEAVRELKESSYLICSIEQTEKSVPLQTFQFSNEEKLALIFGNEVYGVEQEVIDSSDSCIEIPQTGSKHSLNISVAAGIVIWEIARKQF